MSKKVNQAPCYLISAWFTPAEASLSWLLGIPRVPQGQEEFPGVVVYRNQSTFPRQLSLPTLEEQKPLSTPSPPGAPNRKFKFVIPPPLPHFLPPSPGAHWGLLLPSGFFGAAIIPLHGWINKIPWAPPRLGKYQELFVSIPRAPMLFLLFYTEGFRAFQKAGLFLEWQELCTQLVDFSKQATQHSLEFCCEPEPFSRELGRGKPCIYATELAET